MNTQVSLRIYEYSMPRGIRGSGPASKQATMCQEFAARERHSRINLTLKLETEKVSHFILYCSARRSGQTRGVPKCTDISF